MALIEYATGDGFVVLTHTEVPPAYEGQGIGKELVLAALEDIRSKGLRCIRTIRRIRTVKVLRACFHRGSISSKASLDFGCVPGASQP